MSYYSRLDIRLGRIAVLPDEYEDLYPYIQEIHNAIHLISANTDATVSVITPPKPEAPPSQNFGFQLKSFFAPVADTVPGVGYVVHMPPGSPEYILGADGFTSGRKVTGPWAFTLGDRDSSGMCLLGMPPAVIPLEGADTIGALITTRNTGSLYMGETGSAFWAVGQVIQPGFILLQPHMYI